MGFAAGVVELWPSGRTRADAELRGVRFSERKPVLSDPRVQHL